MSVSVEMEHRVVVRIQIGQPCLHSEVVLRYSIRRCNLLSHAMFHFVTALASELTVQRVSGRPIRAVYKIFNTILEATPSSVPFVIMSGGLIMWSSMQGVDLRCKDLTSFLASSR